MLLQIRALRGLARNATSNRSPRGSERRRQRLRPRRFRDGRRHHRARHAEFVSLVQQIGRERGGGDVANSRGMRRRREFDSANGYCVPGTAKAVSNSCDSTSMRCSRAPDGRTRLRQHITETVCSVWACCSARRVDLGTRGTGCNCQMTWWATRCRPAFGGDRAVTLPLVAPAAEALVKPSSASAKSSSRFGEKRSP